MSILSARKHQLFITFEATCFSPNTSLPACSSAAQSKGVSYRNQDLIKDLTAGQLSVLRSDPTFRFNSGINCAFTQQNCTLVRSLPTSERSPVSPRGPKNGPFLRGKQCLTNRRAARGAHILQKQKISLNLRLRL